MSDENNQICQLARIKLSPEGAYLVAKAVKGRFLYKRHFSLKMDEICAVSFFPEGCPNNSTTSARHPVKSVCPGILCVFLSRECINSIETSLPLQKDMPEEIYDFREHGLIIEVCEDL